MLQPFKAFFDALNFGLQQVAEIVKTFVHGVAQIVDTAILKIYAKQVATYDDSDRAPLGELVHIAILHWTIFTTMSLTKSIRSVTRQIVFVVMAGDTSLAQELSESQSAQLCELRCFPQRKNFL